MLLLNFLRRIRSLEHNWLSLRTCCYSVADRTIFSFKSNWNAFNIVWQKNFGFLENCYRLKITTLQPHQPGNIWLGFWPFKIVLDVPALCTVSFNWEYAFNHLLRKINFHFQKRRLFFLFRNQELILNLTEIFFEIVEFSLKFIFFLFECVPFFPPIFSTFQYLSFELLQHFIVIRNIFSSLLNVFFYFSDQTLKKFLINFGNLICHLLGRAHQRNLRRVLPLVLLSLRRLAFNNHFLNHPHDRFSPLNLSFEESAQSFYPPVIVTDFRVPLLSKSFA